jgi:hypothetical protein
MRDAFDPETLTLLRGVLDEAWASLPPQDQEARRKSDLAQRILNLAARGERDPVKLKAAALITVVNERTTVSRL